MIISEVEGILWEAALVLGKLKEALRSKDLTVIKELNRCWADREEVAQLAHDVDKANAEYRKKHVEEV